MHVQLKSVWNVKFFSENKESVLDQYKEHYSALNVFQD